MVNGTRKNLHRIRDNGLNYSQEYYALIYVYGKMIVQRGETKMGASGGVAHLLRTLLENVILCSHSQDLLTDALISFIELRECFFGA